MFRTTDLTFLAFSRADMIVIVLCSLCITTTGCLHSWLSRTKWSVDIVAERTTTWVWYYLNFIMVFGYHMLNILELNTLFVSVVRLWNLNVCLFCRAQDLSDAEPTITHMCISQLYRKGHVCSTAFQKKKKSVWLLVF